MVFWYVFVDGRTLLDDFISPPHVLKGFPLRACSVHRKWHSSEIGFPLGHKVFSCFQTVRNASTLFLAGFGTIFKPKNEDFTHNSTPYSRYLAEGLHDRTGSFLATTQTTFMSLSISWMVLSSCKRKYDFSDMQLTHIQVKRRAHICKRVY